MPTIDAASVQSRVRPASAVQGAVVQGAVVQGAVVQGAVVQDAVAPGAIVVQDAAVHDDARRAAALQSVGASTTPCAPVQGGGNALAVRLAATQSTPVQGGKVEPPTKREPPPPIRAGVAWGDVVVVAPQPSRVDPVWFTFDGVINDDRAAIEVQGTDGAWRTLPALLSRAEQGASGAYRFVLQTSVEEAVALGLRRDRATAFRIVSTDGVASKATPPVVVNDPRNALSRPDLRPMEDRFAGDDHVVNGHFEAQAVVLDPATVEAAARALRTTVDGGSVHLSWPAGSLDPGLVMETHPPVYASGHGVCAALAYAGTNETRANPDGSLTMTLPADEPVVLRARHAAGSAPVAVALVDGERLVPWSERPFASMEAAGRWSFGGYAASVKLDSVRLSDDGSSIEAPAGTIPAASYLAVHNVSAKGLRWATAAYARTAVRGDGSFSIPVRDAAFGGLRVNDRITFIVGPKVQGLDDALVVSLTYDGKQLVSTGNIASLVGAQKNGFDVAPKNG